MSPPAAIAAASAENTSKWGGDEKDNHPPGRRGCRGPSWPLLFRGSFVRSNPSLPIDKSAPSWSAQCDERGPQPAGRFVGSNLVRGGGQREKRDRRKTAGDTCRRAAETPHLSQGGCKEEGNRGEGSNKETTGPRETEPNERGDRKRDHTPRRDRVQEQGELRECTKERHLQSCARETHPNRR